MLTNTEKQFLEKAIELSRKGMQGGSGGPFGCIVVKDGKVIGEGYNKVTSSNDPTAHAEVVAIRDACKALNDFQLTGCDIYTSCEPCPMCLGAIYWARPDRVFFACTRDDAAGIGFDDRFIYEELEKENASREMVLMPLMREEALEVFHTWSAKPDKVEY